MRVFIPETFRITKPSAHLYLFCDFDRFHELRSWCSAAGWKVFRTPLIWYKRANFRAPWPEHGPQRKYETILFAIKGDRVVNKLAPDVLDHNSDSNLDHSAQKPVSLYQDLLSRSARAGDRVLDPFAGTCPIFPAAQALTCFATGIEVDPSYYSIGVKRLQTLQEGAKV